MKTKTKTVEITYKIFEPGDLVVPTSHRFPLPHNVYVVTEFYEPNVPHELDGTVFLKDRQFGQSAEFLRLATENEVRKYGMLTADQEQPIIK